MIRLLLATLALQAGPDLPRMVAEGRLHGIRWERFPDVQGDLRALYERNQWQPLWVVNRRASDAARKLVEVLAGAGDFGLDAEDYDASRLTAQVRALDAGGADQLRIDGFDVALGVAALRFVSAVAVGRVDPRRAQAQLPPTHVPFDAVDAVNRLRRGDPPARVLASIEPPWVHYHLLKQALAKYRELAHDTTLLRLPRPPRRGVREGESYAGAGALRRLLAAFADLDAAASRLRPADTVLTPELVDGMRQFQVRQGFRSDGVLGDSTWARLTRPFGHQLRQMALTLERWRWLPREFASPPIVVNIPAFRLHFFTAQRDEESTVLSMNVVVGKAFRSETPVFADEMTHVIFRPYWEVPPSIAREEILPKALKEASYLERNGYELMRGEKVVPADAANVADIGRSVRVRQVPGPENSLGNVKFMLPNQFSVYLHDTPARSLFERSRRDFSHGCIRVADAELLAELVLRDQPEWTAERIGAAMQGGEPLQVNLKRKIPVLVLYGTALARENGQVYFYQDIYGHDRRLERLLAKGYPYRGT